MTKKILALLLSVLMSFSMISALAATEVEVAEPELELGRVMTERNFEGDRIGFKLATGSELNSVKLKYSRATKSNYVQITRMDNIAVYVQNDWASESPEDVVVETDIMLEVMGNSVQAIAFRGSSVISVSASGVVSAGGQNLGKLDLYTWYTLSAACDFRTMTYDVYINGKLVGTDFPVPIQEEGQTRPSSVRINIPKSTTAETTVGIDNFAIYQATAPVTRERRTEIANSLDRQSAYYDERIIYNALEGMFAFNYKANFAFSNGEKIRVEKPGYIKEDGTVYVLESELLKGFGREGAIGHPYAETVDGKVYVPVKDYAENDLGKRVFIDEAGLVVVSDKEFLGETDQTVLEETTDFLAFLRPTRHDLKADFEKMGSGGVHPRLLARPETIERIKGYIADGDEYMIAGYKNIIGKANGYCDAKVLTYSPNSQGQILGNSRDLLDRTDMLGTAYLLTGDPKYAECCYDNLMAVANFPDWNHHTHWLDTGEMGAAFAFGYDAIYNYLTPERREPLVKAMVDFSFTPGRATHYSGGMKYKNNWNSVCNGGTAMIAMCLLDEPGYEELAFDLVEKCMRGLEYMMHQYAPDGAWEESPGYWNLAMHYMLKFLGSLENVFGSVYYLNEYEGFANSGYFSASAYGPVGLYNYHDSSFYTPNYYQFMWLAHVNNDPGFAALRLYDFKMYNKPVISNDMFWYKPEYKNLKVDGELLPLDAYFRGTELISLRSTWTNTDGIYVGAHAGYGKTAHWNLDSGTFVIDALGERWAKDLGAGDYSWPGFINNQSYLYYQKRTEGQNCVVINPVEYTETYTMGQDWYATSPVVKFETKEKGGYAVVDLTDAYDENGATSYLRGFKIEDNRNSITIRDELNVTGDNNEIYWFMHTDAKFESVDGDKIILERNGKKLLVEFAVEGASSYTVAETVAEPLPQSPHPEVQGNRNWGKKITVIAKGGGEIAITAKFMPLAYAELLPGVQKTKIADWSIPDGSITKIPTLTGITVDGVAIEGFDPETTAYKVVLSPDATQVPVIAATGENVKVDISQSETTNGTAQIRVISNEDSTAVNIYNVKILQLPKPQPIEGRERYAVYSIDCADIPQEENPPEAMFDEQPTTRWSAEGAGVSATADLGGVKQIGAIGVNFHKGESRQMDFAIEISEDGSSYEALMTHTSVLQAGMVVYPVSGLPRNARFVRIVCRGGESSWFSVNELAILGAK